MTDVNIKLSKTQYEDLVGYCKLNNFEVDKIVKSSYLEGFNIERYGLLNSKSGVKEKIVEKEIIKYVEVPKEIEKEVIKIEYVEIEKPVEIVLEVVKEVPVEKVVEVVREVPTEKVVEVIKEVPIEKIIQVSDDSQINELLSKIRELENRPPTVVEVVKEIPVEKVVVHEKRVEVPIEKIVEVVRESGGVDKSKFDALQQTVIKLRQETLEKDRLIKQYEKTIEEIQKFQNNKQAAYMKGSNLDDSLYK